MYAQRLFLIFVFVTRFFARKKNIQKNKSQSTLKDTDWEIWTYGFDVRQARRTSDAME